MAEQFIWADDSGTMRVAWDGRDGYTVYLIETMEVVDEFTAPGAYDPTSARAVVAAWWDEKWRLPA